MTRHLLLYLGQGGGTWHTLKLERAPGSYLRLGGFTVTNWGVVGQQALYLVLGLTHYLSMVRFLIIYLGHGGAPYWHYTLGTVGHLIPYLRHGGVYLCHGGHQIVTAWGIV